MTETTPSPLNNVITICSVGLFLLLPTANPLTASNISSGQILVLAHSDTVWPLGTLAQMPFREQAGRLSGPGVLDMKSGIAFFLFAVRVLKTLEIPVARKSAPSVPLHSHDVLQATCHQSAEETAAPLKFDPPRAREPSPNY